MLKKVLSVVSVTLIIASFVFCGTACKKAAAPTPPPTPAVSQAQPVKAAPPAKTGKETHLQSWLKGHKGTLNTPQK